MTEAVSQPAVWQIEQAEYDDRLTRVRFALVERELAALVVFGAHRIAYLTGFFHIHTERPIVLVITPAELGLLIPKLEQEHVAGSLGSARLAVYSEYPGTRHPMSHLADLLAELGLGGKRIGYDHDGYYDVNGYLGPPLSSLLERPGEPARDIVDTMRMVKSEAELRLLRESARWGDETFAELVARIEPGRAPREVALEASLEGTRRMTATLGPTYRPLTIFLGPPARAVLHAGANTVFPHGLGSGEVLRRGDVLSGLAHADVGGYIALQGRTMFLGEPDPRCVRAFSLMLELREVALEALRPGRRLCEVEADICRAYERLGVLEWQRHHSGHSLGLELHEPPFIDLGDERVVEPGMLFAVEPALYLPELGGFAHGDTVVVTATGVERLTLSPLDLDALTIDV